DHHTGPTAIPTIKFLTAIHNAMELLVVLTTHRHQIFVCFSGHPLLRCVIPRHTFIGHMVQVQAVTVHQGHATDLTTWLVSSCSAITEPAHPPKPPLLRPKIAPILLVPRSVESIS